MMIFDASDSRGFGDLAGTDAAGAHLHVLRSPIHHRAHALEIGQPPPFGYIVGVGDVAPGHRTLAADFTSLRHSNSSSRTPHGAELNNTGSADFQVRHRPEEKNSTLLGALSDKRRVQ
jgi:hypothetical protein